MSTLLRVGAMPKNFWFDMIPSAFVIVSIPMLSTLLGSQPHCEQLTIKTMGNFISCSWPYNDGLANNSNDKCLHPKHNNYVSLLLV